MGDSESYDIASQKAEAAIEFEKKHVHDVYAKVADHFHETRYKPWPVVKQFLMDLSPGSIGADLGCGNGKYLWVNSNVYMIGIDRCEQLLKHASTRNDRNSEHVVNDVSVGDHLNVPILSGSMDFAISIAVLHHFSTVERRKEALREIFRILKPNGRFLVFVWAFEQESTKRSFQQQDTMVPWSMQTTNQHEMTTFQRYYHVFTKGELEDLLRSSAESYNIIIDQSGYEKDNWFAMGRRAADHASAG
jgi:tRNA (uracil-5-)-methyltransferase TRM9